MRIVAIDPGTNFLGWSVLEGEGSTLTLVDCGVLQLNDSDSLIDRLNKVYFHTYRVLSEYPSNILALEKTWKVDRGSLALVVAIRVIKEAAELVEGLKVVQNNAVSVRAAYGLGARDSQRAKENVKKFILGFYDVDATLPYDVFDSILLGIWAFGQYK